MINLLKIFQTKKPIIGMLHIDDLEGTPNFKGFDYLIQRAKRDIAALQKGGIDGILIENWKEDSIGEFVSPKTVKSFKRVVSEIVNYIKVPFGINVLNNDYKVALSVAKLTSASFVQLDVFVDHVQSNFSHSPIASKNPFEINPNPLKIKKYAKAIGAEDIPLFVFVQPKHYLLLEGGKTIEESVKQAVKAGAFGLIVTKETGTAPTLELIRRAKSVSGGVPVGIGSGFSIENAKEFLGLVDFAIVGTSIKENGETDNQVDENRVKQLMFTVNQIRKT